MIKKIQALITTLGLRSNKEDIVLSFTGSRTSSIKEMEQDEMSAFLKWLELKNIEESEKREKQIRKACYLFRQMGYTKSNGTLDYDRIDGFCEKRAAAKKRFQKMTNSELTVLITQLEQIQKRR